MNERVDIYGENPIVEYKCNHCLAYFVAQKKTAILNKCIYCDSQLYLNELRNDEFYPKSLIPFAISRERALSIYDKHINKQLFLPRYYHDKVAKENIQAVYIPVFLFRSDVEADITSKSGVVEKSSVFLDDDSLNAFEKIDTINKEREINSFYKRMNVTERNVCNVSYDNVPVSASIIIDSEQIEKIEPYYYNLVDFSALAIRDNIVEIRPVECGEFSDIAMSKMENFATLRAFKDDFKFSFRKVSKSSFNHKNFDCTMSVLQPIYYIKLSDKGTSKYVIINGQSGKLDLNLDKKTNKNIYNKMAAIYVSLVYLLLIILALSLMKTGALFLDITTFIYTAGFIAICGVVLSYIVSSKKPFSFYFFKKLNHEFDDKQDYEFYEVEGSFSYTIKDNKIEGFERFKVRSDD